MKIVYCIAGIYNSGGMERVLSNKANYLASHGYEVHIVTTDQRGRAPFFEFRSEIIHHDLGINYEENNGRSFFNKLLKYPGKLFLHRRRLSKLLNTVDADITVSMFCNEVSFLSRIKDRSKKVLEVHFSRYKRLQYGRKGLWKIADIMRSMNDLRLVKKYDKFIVLTKEDAGYWGALSNIIVIPNSRSFVFESPASLQSSTVIAVGRYNYQKGYDRLIHAWKYVVETYPEARLRIIGDGELREQMELQVKSLNLSDSIILGRAEKDIKSLYHEASLLVLSSHYEGLPMVLLEAQAAGLPIVSFDCKCGPKDVIEDGVTGFLVKNGDIIGLSKRILEVLKNRQLRTEMGEKAFRNSAIYDKHSIMSKWVSLFNELCE